MPGAGSDRLLAVLRTDIVESTPFQLQVGDDIAIGAFTHHLRSIGSVAEAHGGAVVSERGDGLFAVFDTVSAAARAAQEIQGMNDRRARWREMSPFGLRIGIAVGELTEDEGHFKGRPMLEAERFQEVAEEGQIVCSSTAAAMTAGRLKNDLRPIGAFELKGFDERVELLEIGWTATANPMAALAVPLQREPATRFVGREDLLGELTELWEQAVEGRPRFVLIEGEAGIGKSRLAREMAVAANTAGAVPIYAPCQRDGDQPYGALSRCLRDYLSRLRGQSHLLGPNGPDLASLVPELGDIFPDMAMPLRADVTSRERGIIRRAVQSWLDTAAGEDPVLLLVEDLQWVDEHTLSVLTHVVEHMTDQRLLIIGTLRPLGLGDTGIESELGQLQRRDSVLHRPLYGLDHAATVDLIEDLAGHSLHDTAELGFARNLHTHTGGNPFFVQAVLGNLVAKGHLRQVEGRWAAAVDLATLASPPAVREAVLGQLAGFDRDEARLLQVAAVLGTEFRLTMLQRVAEHLGLVDLGPIDRAVRAALLHEVPGQADSFRFSHELVRTVFEDDVRREERAKIHELAGETLLDLAGGTDHVDDGTVSYHFIQSLNPAIRVRGASHAVTGGYKASRDAAYEQASALYRRAIDVLDDPTSPREPRLRADALLGAALASHKAGDPGAAELVRGAVVAAEELGDGELLAKASLIRSRAMFTRTGSVDHEMVDAFDRALALLGPETSALRSVVLASLGAELTYSADLVRQTEVLTEAEELAHALVIEANLGDRSLKEANANLGKVLALKANAIWRPATLPERLEISNELEQLTASITSLGWRFSAASLGFQASMEAGLFARADMLLGRMEHLSERLQEPQVAWFVNVRQTVRASTVGHLEQAADLAKRGLDLGTESRWGEEAMLYYLGQQWIINYHLGTLADIEETFAFAARSEDRPVLNPALAAIRAEIGDLDGCRALLSSVDANTFSLNDQDLLVTAAVTAIASAAAENATSAALAYETLRPFESQMIDNASTHFGSVHHYLGLALAAMGRPDEAIDRLRRGLDVHRAAGLHPLTARSSVELSKLLIANGSTDQVTSELMALEAVHRECSTRGFGGAATSASLALMAGGAP